MKSFIPEEFKKYFKMEEDEQLVFGTFGYKYLVIAISIYLIIIISMILMMGKEIDIFTLSIPTVVFFIVLFIMIFSDRNNVILDKRNNKIYLFSKRNKKIIKTYSWEEVDLQYVRAAGKTSIHLLQIYHQSPTFEIYSFAPANRKPEVYPLMEFITDFMEGNPIKEQYFKKD